MFTIIFYNKFCKYPSYKCNRKQMQKIVKFTLLSCKKIKTELASKDQP